VRREASFDEKDQDPCHISLKAVHPTLASSAHGRRGQQLGVEMHHRTTERRATFSSTLPPASAEEHRPRRMVATVMTATPPTSRFASWN